MRKRSSEQARAARRSSTPKPAAPQEPDSPEPAPQIARPVLEALPCAACLLDAGDLSIRFANQRFSALVREAFADARLEGRRLGAVLSEEARDALLQAVARAEKSGVAVSDGAALPGWQAHVAPIRDSAGALRWHLLTATEKAVSADDSPAPPSASASEHRALDFETMLASLADPAVLYGDDGRIQATSPSAAAFFGLDPRGLTPAEFIERVHITREDRSPLRSEELPGAQALRGAVVHSRRLRVRAGDGERVTVVSAAPIVWANSLRGAIAVYHDVTGRDRVEAALRDSEEKLRLAQGAAQLGNWDWDIRTGALVWSDRCKALFGLPLDTEISYERFLAALHPDDRERIDAEVRESLRNGSDYRVEVRVPWPDGTEHWVASYGRTFLDAERRPVRMTGVAFDVTSRKRAERALRESEERFRTLADNIAQLAWIADETGATGWYNKRWFDYTGTTLEEMQGWGWQKVQHPDHADRVLEKFRRCVESGEVWEDIFPLRGKDGRYRWFLSRAVPIRDQDGKVLRWFGTNTDVTDQKVAEEQLRRDETLLAQASEMARLGAWWIDYSADGGADALHWTPQVYRIFGYEPGEVTVTNELFFERVHPDDRLRVRDAVARAIEEKRSYQIEHRILLRDGAERVVLEHGQVFYDDAGRPQRLLGAVQDITDRKRLEQALRDSDRRKDEFMGVLSHELRNPLAPIRNSLYLLHRAQGLDERGRRAAEVIERQVNQLARLVDDLLDVTRIARGKIRLQRARVELAELVRQTVEDHRGVMSAGQLSLHLEVPREPVHVDGDAARLRQVIGNLLQNAAKFTGNGGEVRVRLTREGGGQALLQVEDNGVGIDAETAARLFTPFAQAERSLERTRGGLGLGLASAKGLVELHGGTIEAHSAGVGQGSRFTITLPLAAEPPSAAAGAAAPGTAPSTAVKKVLVVEDNRDSADSLREVLSLAGHQVVVAYDGCEGFRKAQELRPDVILCDIGLPGMDGYAIARAVRKDVRVAGTFLVAVSGYAQPEDVARAREAGFDRHLAKPLRLETLEEVVAGAPAT